MDYYDNFFKQFTAGNITTNWHQLEVGIVAGGTISEIVFTTAMDLPVKSVEKECRGLQMRNGVRQTPTRAFMDDITVAVSSVQGARWILNGLEEACEWSRIRFKPQSRSLVICKGKVDDKFRFQVVDDTIPSVKEKPVKSMGKWFDSTLKYRSAVKEVEQQWMRAIDKTGLPGKFKALIYQHGILPRIMWPLLIYDVTPQFKHLREKSGPHAEIP